MDKWSYVVCRTMSQTADCVSAFHFPCPWFKSQLHQSFVPFKIYKHCLAFPADLYQLLRTEGITVLCVCVCVCVWCVCVCHWNIVIRWEFSHDTQRNLLLQSSKRRTFSFLHPVVTSVQLRTCEVGEKMAVFTFSSVIMNCTGNIFVEVDMTR
jgi:hypothetical protein